MSVRKNEKLIIEITGMTADGNGVGKTENGFAVFVSGSAVGDVLNVLVVKVLKNYAFGKILEVITASKDRISADCTAFMKCGGCTFRHITYESELKIKQQRVKDAIMRIGGLENVKINPISDAASQNFYRNKAQLPIGVLPNGDAVCGFYALHSHRIIQCTSCKLQPEFFSKITSALLDYIKSAKEAVYDEHKETGNLRHLYIRHGEETNETMVCLVSKTGRLKNESLLTGMLLKSCGSIKSIVINTNSKSTNVILGHECRTLYGSPYITDRLLGLTFKLSPLSFYQVNRIQAEKLYKIAAGYAALSKDDTLADLYCGTGTIGLTMARYAKQVIGIEIVKDAIDDANGNARINGIENARFICSDSKNALEVFKNEGVSPDVIVIDPPRKGCSSELIAQITEISPRRIVYVSCDPATLARDLKVFSLSGYRVLEITPVDMFPRTAHVETVALVSK